MKYKVCILAAGVGSRMGELSNHIHKAVLPVNFKAVISHIVEKFSKDIEIVVAVGHKKDTVKNYLAIAHPDRLFTFVDVDKYTGPSSGPGYSLLQCKNHLQTPFVFFAADTIVLEEIPAPDHNWFGIAPVKDTEQYCTVRIKDNLVYHLDDKVKNNNRFAFIGLAGISDYDIFFKALEENKGSVNGEIQVTNGFEKLIEKSLVPIGFTWFDTGTLNKYLEANKNFSNKDQEFDFSKSDEFLYFIDGKVIKFFANEDVAKKRYERAIGPLKGLCPRVEEIKGQFYSYKKVGGQVLYENINSNIFNNFLHWAQTYLWKKNSLSGKDEKNFYDACHAFYYQKTKDRLSMFHKKTARGHETKNINDVFVPHIDDLLCLVDWRSLSQGTPANFHGDLQFDNILSVFGATDSSKDAFVLLDWRHDFGGLTAVGDLYYDLAKLYGGILLPYNLIKKNMFSFEIGDSSVYYDFYTKHKLLEIKDIYESFIQKNGFDIKKIKTITALIFLNMSPLHMEPFGSMLYHLGRYMLYKTLKNI